MEEQAQALLQLLKRTSAPNDQKITQFNNLKSSIKHLRVPDGAQPTIFECIKVAISSQTSSQLVSSAFGCVGHLIKRLHLQNQDHVIVNQAGKLYPVLLERLGDARESHRNAASQTLSDLWPFCDKDIERLVRDSAIAGTNARAKETGMQWVVKMHKNEGLPFRGFVPGLVGALEDPDGGVRDVAKGAVVELFRYVSWAY
jgi:CLIP-associating protein 1/2